MLITTRTAFLQQIQKSATNGYIFYTSGEIQASKLPKLTKKFADEYDTNLNRQKAYRRKKKGLGNAKFYVFASSVDNPTCFFWVLMITKGKHPAHQQEQLISLLERKSRLKYLNFELVKQPSTTGRTSFTWRLDKEAFFFLKEAVEKAVRSKNLNKVRQTAQSLNYLPGFAGIRAQRFKLIGVLKSEARRNFKKALEVEIPNFFTRQVKVYSVIYLDAFIRKLEASDRTILEQLHIHHKNLKSRLKSQNRALGNERGAGVKPQIGEAEEKDMKANDEQIKKSAFKSLKKLFIPKKK